MSNAWNDDPDAGPLVLEEVASAYRIPAACRCNWQLSPDMTWVRLAARVSCPLHGRDGGASE